MENLIDQEESSKEKKEEKKVEEEKVEGKIIKRGGPCRDGPPKAPDKWEEDTAPMWPDVIIGED
jgi:hypothetical protein